MENSLRIPATLNLTLLELFALTDQETDPQSKPAQAFPEIREQTAEPIDSLH